MENETSGLRLLKKSKKGIHRIIFSRTGIITLLFLLNVGFLFALFLKFEDFLPHAYGGGAILTVCMVIYLINSRMDPTAKITWLILIMLLPVFGSLLYLFTRADIGHKTVKKKLKKIYKASSGLLGSNDGITAALEKENKGAAALVRYVEHFTDMPLYTNTEISFFPLGDDVLEPILEELKKAKKSIYLEYFIIEEGIMWGKILEVLAKKAAEGVDVRVMYDGSCEFALLPKSYPKKLRSLGIKCRVFAPVTPFISTHYNYRDHRKILTVDGKVAFTGGVNLADEYINQKKVYGHWKDTAVRLRGDAAASFELMFLQIWNLDEKTLTFPLSEKSESRTESEGYVMPYFEDPLDNERVGRQVYIDILNRAERYVHIITPYLILDGELESALTYAAKRGVDVRLILPGIPDKKVPYALAKGHYAALIEAGVRIYEYIPGFAHAKVVISDGREAVVGTINFDYRSLYHHFECAAYLYGVPCLSDISRDFGETMSKCKEITPATIRKEKLYYKIIGYILKALSPLM